MIKEFVLANPKSKIIDECSGCSKYFDQINEKVFSCDNYHFCRTFYCFFHFEDPFYNIQDCISCGLGCKQQEYIDFRRIEESDRINCFNCQKEMNFGDFKDHFSGECGIEFDKKHNDEIDLVNLFLLKL